MTKECEPEAFKMDTETIPEGVDPQLAAQRSALIQKFREGEVGAEDTMRNLLKLYWDTQRSTNGETNVYLMAASYEFPVEANMPMDISDSIWQEAMARAIIP